MRQLLILWIFLTLSLSSLQATGDSIHYLLPGDTVFIETGSFGEKIFHHKLAKKQTLYSLAKFYGIHINELFQYNPQLADLSGISPGTPVRIPIPNRAIIRFHHPEMRKYDYVPVYYKVRRGDNLFRISRYHFRMPKDTIIKRNRLLDLNLKPDQLLHVGWISIFGIPENLRSVQGGPFWTRSHELEKEFYSQTFAQKQERMEQGSASWPSNAKMSTQDLFALHNKAPINSIISVTNPMTNRTVYVKVLARIPALYEKNTIVVVSPKVAQMLGILDPHFFAQVRYFH